MDYFFFQNPKFISLLCGLGAFAVVVLVWTALIENDPLPDRLKNLAQRRSELEATQRQKKFSRRASLTHLTLMKIVVKKLKLLRSDKMDALKMRLARAGYRSRDAIFTYMFMKFMMPLLLPSGVFFYIFVLHAVKLQPLLGGLITFAAAPLGFLAPDVFLKNNTQKRITLLQKSLPDAMDLMVICAEAGLGMDSAFDRVSREIGPTCPELAEEIGLTAIELNFLPDRAKALQNLASRIPLPGVLSLTNTLIQTEKYGTPLAQSLRVLSAEMREERIMAAETKAAKLSTTLTVPAMLFIFPALFIVLLGPAVLEVMNIAKSGN